MSALTFTPLDGSNPLMFLAGLGTLRLATLCWPEREITLHWSLDDARRPVLTGPPTADPSTFCKALLAADIWAPMTTFAPIGSNLTVPPESFAAAVELAIDSADRLATDFIAAFACESIYDRKKNRIEYTELCFITGSGHQDFLGTAQSLAERILLDHLQEALFGPWKTQDDGRSFRWDPDDAAEYALRYGKPSKDGVSSVWGASRLAFEALPLFPTAPMGRHLGTTGFHREAKRHYFYWPIWTCPLTLDEVSTLLGLEELRVRDRRDDLARRGVAEVFRAERVRIGQGANFKVSFRPAVAV